MEEEDKIVSDRWKENNKAKNDIPASSGVFGLQLLAYHGNNCSDLSHLGCLPQGLRFIKARSFKRMEKETEIGSEAVARESGGEGRVVVVTDDATVGVVLGPNGALQRQ